MSAWCVEVVDNEVGVPECYVGHSDEMMAIHEFPGGHQVSIGLDRPFVFNSYWIAQAVASVADSFIDVDRYYVRVRRVQDD